MLPVPSPSDDRREALRRGLLNTALKFGMGVDMAGSPYTWMMDTRELLLKQPYLKLCGALLWERLRPYKPEAVGGMTLAANPLTAAVLYEAWAEGYPLEGFLIRKMRKENGLRKLVEGPPLKAGMGVVLVDDMVNSGTTQRQAIRALEPFQPHILAVGAVLDAERAGGEWLRDRGIGLEALFGLTELGILTRPAPRTEGVEVAWRWGKLNSGTHSAPHSQPALTADRIVVGSDQGIVICLDLQGRELWQFTARDSRHGIHSSPVVREGKVWIGSYDGFVYCLDLSTGALVWERRIAQWVGSSPVLDTEGKIVFIGAEYGDDRGGVVALHSETGEPAWETLLPQYVHSSPCFDAARNRVLSGCNDGNLYSFNADSGAIVWKSNTGGPIKAGPSIDAHGRCFASSMNGSIFVFDAESGRILWSRRLGRSAYFRPLIHDELVFAAGSSGRLVCMESATGEIHWIAATGSGIVGGAAMTEDGRIVVGSGDGCIYLLNAHDGRTLSTTRTGAAITVEPGVRGRFAAVPSRDGFLYCIALQP